MSPERPSARPLALLLGWLPFACMGTLFVLVGLGIAAAFAIESQHLTRADGYVVDYEQRGNQFHAVVEFTALDGARITFVDSTSGSAPLYRLEQQVEVRYDPAAPRRTARVHSFISLWLLPAIFAGIGGLFAAIGWIGLVRALRRRARGV
jgi:ABC-type antimicrobial peptide transport system permease subunit